MFYKSKRTSFLRHDILLLQKSQRGSIRWVWLIKNGLLINNCRTVIATFGSGAHLKITKPLHNVAPISMQISQLDDQSYFWRCCPTKNRSRSRHSILHCVQYIYNLFIHSIYMQCNMYYTIWCDRPGSRVVSGADWYHGLDSAH